MFGGVGKSAGWATILGTVGFVLSGSVSAKAADLGGDCCADLEERIAELEATTARKGNRQVSLTISGWVNEAVFLWDDGTEKNVYVGTNAIEQSRFRFVGEAKIDDDWSAGYTLEIGVQGDPSNQWSQSGPSSANLNPSNQDNALLVRKSYWFIKSKRLGQVAVGTNGTATYHLLDDADQTLTRNVDDAEGAAIYQSAFQLRRDGQAIGGSNVPLKWTDALRGFNNSTPGDSGRRSVVRYDSPTIAGFVGSAAWGEDDLWDLALTYKGDIGDFSVLARAGYGESTDAGAQIGPAASGNKAPTSYVVGGSTCISSSTITNSATGFKCSWEGAGATVLHKPTGLFVFGGWGRQSIETASTTLLEPDSTVWFVQPGIERKWFALGKTNIFAEYRRDDAGSNPGKTMSAKIDFWQAGVVQSIEAADASLYFVYQHADGDITGNATTSSNGAPVGTTSLDAFQELIVGTKINF